MTITQVRLGAAALAASAAILLTLQATNAAFSAQTANNGNSFSAGTVTLSDDDAGTALFTAPNLAPGDSVIGCIEVTYSGSLDADVRLFGSIAGGTGLEAYLDLEIERGTGTCAAFGTATTVWSAISDGDLGGFVAAHTGFASGADTWAPGGGAPDDTVPYRFTVSLQDDAGAQGKSATVEFTWEAQNA